ncbi:MAG: hypothetical protein H6573_36360 [Lewinellaceae bacterium]|nr:hypothetical protein [Lewinellaceae bacterium]
MNLHKPLSGNENTPKGCRNRKAVRSKILESFPNEMPLRKDGWQFTWKKLAKVEGAQFYKITLKKSPEAIEGVLMITLINDEMLYMNNVEVAPHNYGRKGKYENVAGCLIAFACKKSFELGKGHYLGFLSFDSKTELISLYQDKYGATWAMGQKMFIDPVNGRKLMGKYLSIKPEGK